MTVTIDVDPVEPAVAPADTISLAELVGEHDALGLPGALRVLPVRGVHPLLAAVHAAFVEHRPLVLSPDAVWLTIAGGMAHHVRLHAEALRPRLVRHGGKRTLVVEGLAAPSTVAEWRDAVEAFRRAVADDLGQGLARLFVCDFSTSGDVERIASEIVLLDATSPYYQLVFSIVCGIPRVTLTGTPADWRALRARVDVVAELGLERWAASLAPICDRLVDAAEGRGDAEFFRAIYKPRQAYARDEITGWVARLYPYVRDEHGTFRRPNPLLARGLDEPAADSGGDGITAAEPPPGPSTVVIEARAGAGVATEYQLEGGLLAVEQDGDGRLVPRAGWLVRPQGRGGRAVATRVRREHTVIDVPGRADESGARPRELFDELQEAVLFEGAGAWRILPPQARERILIGAPRLSQYVEVQRLVDLPDGSLLASAQDTSTGAPLVVWMRAETLGDEVLVHLRDPAMLAELRAQLALDPWTDPITGLSRDPGDGTAPPEESAYDDDAPLRYRSTSQRFEDIPVLPGTIVDVLAAALERGGALPTPGGARLIDHAASLWDGTYHADPLLVRLRRCGGVVAIDPRRDHAPWFERIDRLEVPVGAGGRWRLLPPAERRAVVLRAAPKGLAVETLVDLGDGTALATTAAFSSELRRFVHLRVDGLPEIVTRPAKGTRAASTALACDAPLDEVAVIGRTLVEILTHALDHGALPPPRGTLAR